jgi:hypothetical protein
MFFCCTQSFLAKVVDVIHTWKQLISVSLLAASKDEAILVLTPRSHNSIQSFSSLVRVAFLLYHGLLSSPTHQLRVTVAPYFLGANLNNQGIGPVYPGLMP